MNSVEKGSNRRAGFRQFGVDVVKLREPFVGNHAIGFDIPVPDTDAAARRKSEFEPLAIGPDFGFGVGSLDMRPRPFRDLADQREFARAPHMRVLMMDRHQGRETPCLDQRHTNRGADPHTLEGRGFFRCQFF